MHPCSSSMAMKSISFLFLSLALAAVVMMSNTTCSAVLELNFYGKTCPGAETLVKNIVYGVVKADPKKAAKLLRIQYHDCFVRGCDASILLDSPTGGAEKDHEVNSFMAGYDIIDKVKASLENLCPATVSCADIIALVARDAVSQQFGKDLWEVFTGRKDGNTSIAKEALDNLPSPAATFEDLAASFHEKGLNKMDLDILSGAHTIGMAPCSTIATRLMPVTDPTLDQGFAESLKELCNRGQNNVSFGTPRFDNQYYSQLLAHRGVLRSDASLLEDTESLHLVGLLSRGEDTFLKNFGAAMQKMGGIGVLVGSDGGVRTNCIGVQLLS